MKYFSGFGSQTLVLQIRMGQQYVAKQHADAIDPTALGSTGMRSAGDEVSALLH